MMAGKMVELKVATKVVSTAGLTVVKRAASTVARKADCLVDCSAVHWVDWKVEQMVA